MVSLSLLSTAHPRLFQQTWVRASSGCYPTFTLAMDSSPGFGSTASDSTPCSDSVSLRFPYSVKLATNSNSLTHYTKGTQSPSLFGSTAARKPPPALRKGSHCLYAHGFSVYFTPLIGVLFAFPSRYWFTIGRQRVFSLGGWSPLVQTGFHVPRLTLRHLTAGAFQIRGCHPLWPPFPERSFKPLR